MATRDGELFKEKIEVSLDGRQIFCLFCGGAVIASLVFVLGVMIGRRVEARTHPERASASATGDPLAALDQLAAGDADGPGLAFADTLRSQSEGNPLGPVDVSLGKAAAEAEAEAEAAEAQPVPKPVPEVKQPEPPKKVEQPPAAAAAPPPPPKPAPKAAEVAPDKARFTLQLSSFQTRAEADAFAADLQKSGYTPYIVSADVEGKGTWFRVRVGQFASQEDAMSAKSDFESKQKIIAYVTRLKR